jgi:uncharacterized membrane protein
MKKKWMCIAPLAILGIALAVFIGGQLVKQLWNGLLPPLFGVPEVTFWQAFGILALCRILFGGRGFSHSNSRRRSPEERERFRRAMRERFGFGAETNESHGH